MTKLDQMFEKLTKVKSEPQEKSAGFSISTYDQSMIEENARERFDLRYGDKSFRRAMIKGGMMNAAGEITKKGWEQLNKDILYLELHALDWLRKTFNNASDEGHDAHSDLVGMLWYDPRNKEQIEQLYIGDNERIDMNDASYGSLAGTIAWDRVSKLGQNVLGGQVNFHELSLNKNKDGVVVRGAGMDMGMHLVTNLSYRLYGNERSLKYRWL